MGINGSKKPQKSFLLSLLRDKRANTLAIGAAAILPLIGVIGGGVDASRMYLAKSRLQQACDSATLAARKKLGGGNITGGTIPSEIEDTADNFFETNFGDGIYGTTKTSYELTSSVGTRMDGTAETSVPVSLMAVFGFDEIDLEVECSADLNLPNIDISLVLDMSGSMSSTTGGVTRMDALKSAVFAFYDEIMAVAPADARVRIGIVPYNSNINVGNMIHTLNPAFLADSHDYQSREAIFERVMTDPGTPGTPGGEELYSDERELVTKESSSLGSSSIWDYVWSNNRNHPTYGEVACDAYDGTYTVGGERWVITDDDYIRNYFRDGSGNRYGACEARIRKFRTTEGTAAIPPTFEDQFQRYEYKEMNLDTSRFKTFQRTGMPVGSQGANRNSTWNGCIEEATTVAATSFDPIPTGAFDMDIDLVPDPTNVNTQWRPQWDAVTFDRGNDRNGNARVARNQYDTTANMPEKSGTCPAQSYPLTQYDRVGTTRNALFETRVNALNASGGTMHDIGMIWGGRILSPDGIFSGTNTTAPNGDPIIRHLIFMTDGQMGANPNWQIAYGNPDMDGHLAGFKSGTGKWTEAELAVLHNARLDAVCQQIKNKNITIWTVSFTLPLNANTRGCASGNSRAMTADDQSTLITRFRTIASSIAELRLVN